MNNKKVDRLGHPTYVYAKVGKNYKYLGITHSSVTDGITNIKLEKNPNPRDKKTAYVRPYPDKANRSYFGKRYPKWVFSENDKIKIKKLIAKDKHNK